MKWKLEQIKVSTSHSAIKDWGLDAEWFWHPYLTPVLVHFLKTLIEGQIVPDWVLPPRGGVGKVREVFQDPVVYVFNWQSLGGGIFYGHEDEAAEGIRGFAVWVLLGVIREVRVGWGGRGVIVQVLDGADAPQHGVTEAVEQVLALMEPVEISEFLVLHAAFLQFDGGKSQVHLLGLLQGACDGARLIELAQAARDADPGTFRLLTGRHNRTHLDQDSYRRHQKEQDHNHRESKVKLKHSKNAVWDSARHYGAGFTHEIFLNPNPLLYKLTDWQSWRMTKIAWCSDHRRKTFFPSKGQNILWEHKRMRLWEPSYSVKSKNAQHASLLSEMMEQLSSKRRRLAVVWNISSKLNITLKVNNLKRSALFYVLSIALFIVAIHISIQW